MPTFLIPFLSFLLGVLAGFYFDSLAWGILMISFAIITYFIIIKLSSTPARSLKFNKYHYYWAFLLFGGIGFINAYFNKPVKLSSEEIEKVCWAEGIVTGIKSLSTGDRIELNISQLESIDGSYKKFRNFKLLLYTDGLVTHYGEIISFPLNLQEIHSNKNFKYSEFENSTKRKGIFYMANVNSEQIKRKGEENSLSSLSRRFKDKIEILIDKSDISDRTTDFITSILLGDKDSLSEDQRNSFSNAGLAHILALSGMHIAIIYLLLTIIFYPLCLIGLGKWRIWCAIIFIWAFTFLTGNAPSTVRAAIMASLLIIAISFQRKYSTINSLLIAGFIILLIDPFTIFDIGFQLSFLGVCSIIIFYPHFNFLNSKNHPFISKLTSNIIICLIISIALWVMVSFYFKRIPLLFLPANFFILPFLPIFLSLSIVYIICLSLGHDPGWMAITIDHFYSFLQKIVDIGALSGKATVGYQTSFWTIFIWFLILVGIKIALISKKNKKYWFSISGALTLSLFISLFINHENNQKGFIIQKDSSQISISKYSNGKEKIYVFPRNTVCRLQLEHNDIIVLDRNPDFDYLKTLISPRNKRYIIIGKGFSHKNFENLIPLLPAEKIIIHNSVIKKYEEVFKEKFYEFDQSIVHSLRENGPLEIEL